MVSVREIRRIIGTHTNGRGIKEDAVAGGMNGFRKNLRKVVALDGGRRKVQQGV